MIKASNKKSVLVVIASTAGVLLLLAAGVYLYFYFQFCTYQDDLYKFSIKYPRNWTVDAHPKKNVAVVFLRPKDTVLDTVQENFNVTVQPMPNDIYSLDAFTATIKRQMIGVFGKSINIIEDKPIQWGWHDGHILVIDAPTPDHLKLVVAWVLKDNQSYILTFLGDMNKYQHDSILVNEMIRSLILQ